MVTVEIKHDTESVIGMTIFRQGDFVSLQTEYQYKYVCADENGNTEGYVNHIDADGYAVLVKKCLHHHSLSFEDKMALGN